MLARASWRCASRSQFRWTQALVRYSTARDSGRPPHILFFGSDTFSLATLRRLHEAGKSGGDLYRSLEVVTREPAPKGRGLVRQKGSSSTRKRIETVPLQTYAEEQNIPVRTVTKETLKNIKPPLPDISLLIAVSFGLFIPKQLVESAKYTINVHPSLLPQYRGAAPIHHAILNGDTHTGVTLQTLSTKGFDKGLILAQSPPIEIAQDETLSSLWNRLATLGGDLLLQSLRDRTYANPSEVHTQTAESYAPPISKYIDWHQATADYAVRLSRILDPLTGAISLDNERRTDVLIRGISHRKQGSGGKVPGAYFIARHAESGDKKMVVVCADRETVWVDQAKVSGKQWISGIDFVGSSSERFWGERFVPWRREFDEHDPKEFQY